MRRNVRHARYAWTCKTVPPLSKQSSLQTAVEAEEPGIPTPIDPLRLLSCCLHFVKVGSDREEGKSFMPVLVLNSSLQPLSIIPERRLIVLLSRQKVTFVDDAVRQLIEESIQARRLELERPVIVQLLANIRIPHMILQPTRANILLRDQDTCQYCGKHTRDLTLDHIIPRSRGGQNTWENLVASCRPCNGKKGNRFLKDVNMHLMRQPRPLTQEYAGVFLLRYPKLREAYEEFLLSAQHHHGQMRLGA